MLSTDFLPLVTGDKPTNLVCVLTTMKLQNITIFRAFPEPFSVTMRRKMLLNFELWEASNTLLYNPITLQSLKFTTVES